MLEIGYTGRRAMPFPPNYYHKWTHSCNSTHALALAEGEYNGRLTADVPNAVAMLSDATRASPAHTAACGELPLRHAIGLSAPHVRNGPRASADGGGVRQQALSHAIRRNTRSHMTHVAPVRRQFTLSTFLTSCPTPPYFPICDLSALLVISPIGYGGLIPSPLGILSDSERSSAQ